MGLTDLARSDGSPERPKLADILLELVDQVVRGDPPDELLRTSLRLATLAWNLSRLQLRGVPWEGEVAAAFGPAPPPPDAMEVLRGLVGRALWSWPDDPRMIEDVALQRDASGERRIRVRQRIPTEGSAS